MTRMTGAYRSLTLIFLLGLALFPGSSSRAAEDAAPATNPAAKINVVAFYNGTYDLAHINFVHEANVWFPKMGEKYGFNYTETRNWTKLNKDFLSKVQVVLFLDDSPHFADERAAFQEYMESGGGWMGFHVCAFTTKPTEWDWYYNNFLASGAFNN